MNDNLRLLHLATGEDIIGKVSFNAGDSTYIVDDPVSPHMQVDPSTGSVRVGLMPLRPFAEETKQVVLSALHVVYVTPVAEQMQGAYAQYHSNIVLPDTTSLSSLLKG
jgi:hypothetical protein